MNKPNVNIGYIPSSHERAEIKLVHVAYTHSEKRLKPLSMILEVSIQKCKITEEVVGFFDD
jgi:hypothetical protein